MRREKKYWIPVCGWEKSHEISNWGDVRSMARMFLKKDGKLNHYKGRIIKQYPSEGGYLSVGLSFEGIKRTVQVNILMAQSFYDPLYLEKGLVGNHKDGNKKNNYKDNIEITTYSRNMTHAHENGLNKNYGESHYSSKLSDQDIEVIRKLASEGFSHAQIAEKFNIHKNYVGEIWRNEKRKRPTFKDYKKTIK